MRRAFAIAATLAVSACSTTHYHRERQAIPAIEPIGLRDVYCRRGAEAEVRQNRPFVNVEALELGSLFRNCMAGTPKGVQAEYVDKHTRLLRFLGDTLPAQWLSPNAAVDVSRRPHVEVTARHPREEKEAPKPFVSTMSDRGQQGFMDLLAKRGANADAAALLKSLKDAGGAEDKGADPFDLRRTVPLLISTSFNSTNPADRLEKVYIFIQPTNPDAHIVDVEKPVLETVKTTVPIAKETTSENFSPTASLENILVGEAKGKASASASISRTIERNFTKQFAVRSVSLSPERDILYVRQEGQEGIDISGNILSSVTLEIPSNPSAIHFFSVQPRPKPFDAKTENPSLLVRQRHLLHNTGDVDGLITWVAVARIVGQGGDTVTEEDDVVQPRIYSGQSSMNLWRNYESLYTLELRLAMDGSCVRVPLVYFDDVDRGPQRVAFSTLAEARKFKEYLLDPKLEAKAEADGALRLPVRIAWQEDVDRHAKAQKDLEKKQPLGKEVEKSIGLGFPIGLDGKVGRVVDFRWTGRNGMKKHLGDLAVNVVQPDEYPLRLANLVQPASGGCLEQDYVSRGK